MKRSSQVSLVLMAAAGIGAAAYALTPGDNCRPPPPNIDPRATPQVAPQNCRSSRSGWSGRSSFFSSNSGSSSSGSSGGSTVGANGTPASSASRGGFGSIGRAFASFSLGG